MNIRDVAAAAAVSTATVSNALNGTGRVSAATRDHVRRVAETLGYRMEHHRVLGMSATTFGTHPWNFAKIEFFAQSISAATAVAHEHGYALTVLPSTLESAEWRSLQVDGVLLMDSPAGDPVVRTLRERGLPIAFDGRPAEVRAGEVWVDNDHALASRTLLEHLAAQGAERIALVAWESGDHYNQAWIAAYRDWCAERGRPELVGDTIGSLLGSADAIYATYDLGRALLAEAGQRGLRVPEDLLVACVSEDPAYADTDPPVTTVSLLPRESVRLAVGALVGLVEHRFVEPAPPVPTQLTIRQSTMRI